MYDPDVGPRLPLQCKTRKQAAYFFSQANSKDSIRYFYDVSLIKQVQAQPLGELQISYLWVHEWLWNYFPPKEFLKLAYFNRLLHSDRLETLSPTEYKQLKDQLFK